MKSFKRLVTLVVAIAMVLTSVGNIAFASSTFSDIQDEKVATAVDKLVAYKIITGYEDGTFKPDNQITRAEFAAIVTRMKGVANNLPSDSVTGFSDLDGDDSRAWARPYVKAAVDLKIINGFEDGTFRAAEPVTYEQAVKMLVCAVGYEVVANSEYKKAIALNPSATWSAGYIAAANKHGITKGVITAMITEPASRGVVAVLTSNALTVPELVQDDKGNLTRPEDGKEESESTMKTISGVITGTYYTGLKKDNLGLRENEIRIEASDEEESGDYTLTDELLEKIDLYDCIGKRVDIHYDSIDDEIQSMTVKNASITEIDEASIESINGYSIKYIKSNGKYETEDLSGCIFIVNGKYVEDYDFENKFKNGKIEIFSTGSYKIARVNSYEVFVVNSFDKENEKVFLKYANYKGNNYYQFPTRSSDKPKIYVESSGTYKPTEYTNLSLSQYDVINYLESPEGSAGDPVRKMYVSKGAESGKITASLEGEREVEIGDKSLYLTQQYFEFEGNSSDEKAPFELSETYTYYCDYTGQIAAVKYSAAASTGSWAYGYLVEGVEADKILGIIDSSGNYKEGGYELKDTVKVDGEKVKAKVVFDRLEESANVVNENAIDGSDTNKYAQPIRYSVSGGKIEAIDTVVELEGGAGDNFTYDGKGTGEKEAASTTRVTVDGVSYAVNSSTLIIYVPNNRSDDASYAVMKASSAFSIPNKKYYTEVFAVDPTSTNKLAKLVLVYGSNPTLNFTGTSPYMLVSKVRFGGDEQTIEGYVNAAATTTTVNVSADKFINDIDDVESLINGEDVGVGDIIRYIKDNSGKMIAIQMIYDASEEGSLLVDADTDSFVDKTISSSYFVAKYGTANAKDTTDNTLDVLCGDEGSTYRIGSAKIFKLASNGELSTAVVDEIAIEGDGGEPSTIIIISNTTNENATAKLVYIIE